MGLFEPACRRDRLRRIQAVGCSRNRSLSSIDFMPILPLTSLKTAGKRVLVRCDFNVPLEAGKISDPARIDASLDTIKYILKEGGAAVLCSHLGRPKERAADLSLKPVAEYLTRSEEHTSELQSP